MNIEKMVRPEIIALQRYKVPGASEPILKLHKNENPWPGIDSEFELNRYPDPEASDLAALIAQYYKINAENIFLSRGSDEAIDLIMRLFCHPLTDGIFTTPPTFGMYEHYAQINALKIQKIPLIQDNFELDVAEVLSHIRKEIKIVFLCSPNNPTGGVIPLVSIQKLCQAFANHKIVVIDEAYIDFSDQPSSLELLSKYDNLIVLRTLSKGYGLAGVRCGITFAAKDIIAYLKKIAAPYTLSSLTIHTAKKIFSAPLQHILRERIALIKAERDKMQLQLMSVKCVLKIWPSSANFILVKLNNAKKIFDFCLKNRILIRDVSTSHHLDNCLRITVGAPDENNQMLQIFNLFE